MHDILTLTLAITKWESIEFAIVSNTVVSNFCKSRLYMICSCERVGSATVTGEIKSSFSITNSIISRYACHISKSTQRSGYRVYTASHARLSGKPGLGLDFGMKFFTVIQPD